MGIGLNSGATAADVSDAVSSALAEAGLTVADVAVFATAEHRRDHPALWAFDITFVPNDRFTGSAICETAAIVAAQGGPLVVAKRCSATVCVAIASFLR